MTTTELILLLKKVEFGMSGRSRNVSFTINDTFLSEPTIKINSTGDGCAGAELCLQINKDEP